MVEFAVPGDDGGSKLPEVSLGKAAVEPEPSHSVHAVYDSALVRVGPDPEHVLIDHGYGLKDAFVEFLLGPLEGPEDLQCESCVDLPLVALFGIAPLKVTHHEADPSKLSLFFDWCLLVYLVHGFIRLPILVV